MDPSTCVMPNVINCFAGKCVLLTGTTGFVGKALLEKILRSLSTVDKVFVLIRARGGLSASERMKKEIFSSRIFQRLRMERPHFDDYLEEKCIAISGDLLKEGVGLSEADLALLSNRVNIVISCAASVDFNDPLERALQINVLGTLRLFEIAKRFQSLDAFVHTSTCYTNCNRSGLIEETLYPLVEDPDVLLNRLLAMDSGTIRQMTPSVLGNYPNTYTFTKCLCEWLLYRRRERTPLAIVRPSCIGAAYKEPVPGWVDTISAAGALTITCGLGLLHFTQGEMTIIGDNIPVDYVVNCLIVVVPAILYNPNDGRLSGPGKSELGSTFRVFHAGSSHRHPVSWGQLAEPTVNYWLRSPPKRGLSPPSFTMFKSPVTVRTHFFMRYKLPLLAIQGLSKMIPNHTLQKNTNRVAKLVRRAQSLMDSFKFFTSNEWIFDSTNRDKLSTLLSRDDQLEFPTDVADIDWTEWQEGFCYGIQKFYLNEACEYPGDHTNLVDSPSYGFGMFTNMWAGPERIFRDISWASKRSSDLESRYPLVSTSDIKSAVLRSAAVRAAISKCCEDDSSLSVSELETRAKEIVHTISAEVRPISVRFMAWFFRKFYRRVFESIRVDKKGARQLKELIDRGIPVVLVPSHRSYMDFLLISYIMFALDIPIPHICAGEDFLNIAIVNHILRQAGAFFMRRSFRGDVLYTAVFAEYVQRLVTMGGGGGSGPGVGTFGGGSLPVEFFIEGTRSRSGKPLRPKTGMVSIIADTYFKGLVTDVVFQPITISYEKILEGQTFPGELLGESKVKESLARVANAGRMFNRSLGNVSFDFGKPISLHDFATTKFQPPAPMTEKPIVKLQTRAFSLMNKLSPTLLRPTMVASSSVASNSSVAVAPSNKTYYSKKNMSEDRKALISQLSYHILDEITSRLVCTMTSLVACVLLEHRRGISRHDLIAKVKWLKTEIEKRNGIVHFYSGNVDVAVTRALSLLNTLIEQRRTQRIEPAIGLKENYTNILLLAYYRNNLSHVFVFESIVACSLYSFGFRLMLKDGIPLTRLRDEHDFLFDLLKYEYVADPSKVSASSSFDLHIRLMLERGTIICEGGMDTGRVRVSDRGVAVLRTLCSMLWPFIESYWVCELGLSTLLENNSVEESAFLQRIQVIAENMYDETSLLFYESCSVETLRSAINLFSDWGVLVREEGPVVASDEKKSKGKKHKASSVMIRLSDRYASEAALEELGERLKAYRKAPSTVAFAPVSGAYPSLVGSAAIPVESPEKIRQLASAPLSSRF